MNKWICLTTQIISAHPLKIETNQGCIPKESLVSNFCKTAVENDEIHFVHGRILNNVLHDYFGLLSII